MFYVVSIASLLAVAVFGKKYLGARRWVHVGLFHFQPSEWVKLVLILAMAKYFADMKSDCEAQDIVKAGALVGIPMLMVLVQPDLGTALTYLPIAIMGLFLGGMKAKHALVIVLIATLLAPVGWHVLKPYQRDRLTTLHGAGGRSAAQGLPVNTVAGGGGLGRHLWARARRRAARRRGSFCRCRIPTSSSRHLPRNMDSSALWAFCCYTLSC